MKLQGGFLVFFAAVAACSGHSTFDGEDSGGPGSDGGNNNNDQYVPPNNDSGMNFGDTGTDGPGMGGVTTVYANTDDTLYSLNPMTNAVTQIGMFTGFGGGTNDTSATDLAVDSMGNVYINSETVVYKDDHSHVSRQRGPHGKGGVDLRPVGPALLRVGVHPRELARDERGAHRR